MPSPLSVGSHIVTVRCTDAGTEAPGPEVVRSFTILAPPFEDIAANETKVKATHITTLRNAVNAVRIYYSISAASWSEAIVAGRTYIKNWPFHILELRAAIEPVIALINVFDDLTTFEPEWLPLGAGRPRADVMNQLRDIINIL